MPMKKYTTCTMDCPDTCSVEVTIDDGGKAGKLTGTSLNPETNGVICAKVGKFAQRVYHESRIQTPLRRTGKKGSGEFEPISWDAALTEITENFKSNIEKFGGRSILPYHFGGSNGMLGEEAADALLFDKIGANYLDKTICSNPATIAATELYGKFPGVAFSDYPHAKCIIIWGANTKNSNIHLMPFLKKAKRKGAFVASIDPYNAFSSKEIDFHLPIFPGTDLALALAMINYWRENDQLDDDFIAKHVNNADTIIEEAKNWSLDETAKVTGLVKENIMFLADRYAENDPALIRCGWGGERNRNGGQALSAILAIPALMGKFGVRGGGYTLSNTGSVKVQLKDLEISEDAQNRTINMTQLASVLDENSIPAIKTLFVYNSNAVATSPNQNKLIKNMMRDDLFTVVHDQVMTDTCKYADIVLPATTYLEHHELKLGYGSYVLGDVSPVIDPIGESKSNHWLFCELAKRMGLKDEIFTWDDVTFKSKVYESITHFEGKAVSANSEQNASKLEPGSVIQIKYNDSTPIQFETSFPRTSDGKVQLKPNVLGDEPYKYLPEVESEYPFALLSSATNKMTTSTFGEFNFEELYVEMYVDDAKAKKIRNGDTVRVFNELGEVICKVKVNDKIRSGVLFMPKGAWMKSSMNGRTSTALCPESISKVGGAACFNDARVEIELAE